MMPIFEDFLYPFLYALKDGKITSKEVEERIISYFSLTEEECEQMTAGGTRTQLSDRISWCRQYFRRALFISIPKRGIYEITDRGQEYLANHNSLRIEDLLEYKEFREYTNRGKDTKVVSKEETPVISMAKTPTQELEDSYEAINTSLVEDLLDKIMQADWKFFEKLVVDLLVGMGYGGTFKGAAEVTQPSKDGGIDGIIKVDKLGLDSIYLQAKQWTNKVSEPEIAKFAGALDVKRASKGVFITTSEFTKGALDYVEKSPKKIVLIDGKELARYMIEYNVGVAESKKYIVKRIDNDYFEED